MKVVTTLALIVLAVVTLTLLAPDAQPVPAQGGTVRLFGTLGYGSGWLSTLVELNPETGEFINVIGDVGYTVNGLDYDATTGRLYGGTAYHDPSYNGLIEIDMATGVGMPIGKDGWGTGDRIPITCITTNSSGQMYGWSEWSDSLVRINKDDGTIEETFPNYLGTAAYGLAFDRDDNLILVNYDGSIYLIDPSTGEVYYYDSIGMTMHHGDFRFDTNWYYGLDTTGSPRTLLRGDPYSLNIEKVAEVKDLHTLTFMPAEEEPTETPTATRTVTRTPTVTVTRTPTSTVTRTPTNTSTWTVTPTVTNTATKTATPTWTNTPAATNTPRPTATRIVQPTRTPAPSGPPAPVGGFAEGRIGERR